MKMNMIVTVDALGVDIRTQFGQIFIGVGEDRVLINMTMEKGTSIDFKQRESTGEAIIIADKKED